MKVWEEIINTAIIGTDKKTINAASLDIELQTILEQLETKDEDKERVFLNVCAMISNYRKAAFIPASIVVDDIQLCASESFEYCSASAVAALQAILDDDNKSLLNYFLKKCQSLNLIIPPYFLNQLFEKAEKEEQLRTSVVSCFGERGKWMAKFNNDWEFDKTALNNQDIFDHGALEDRKKVLKAWRVISPSEARVAIEKVWSQEQAAVKLEFLKILEDQLEIEDEPFLKLCLKEKSQKVKDLALYLLKKLPASFIVEEVWNFVKPLVQIEKSSSFLGLINKESLEIKLNFDIPEHFKSYGISHIDADKEFTEKEFTMHQLIEIIPVWYWEEHFKLSPLEMLTLFNKSDQTKKYINALALSCNSYQSLAWALVLYKNFNSLCLSAVKDFDMKTKQEIVLSEKEYLQDIYLILNDEYAEWDLNFALNLIHKTAQEPYIFTKQYYRNLIHHFPVEIMEELNQINHEDINKQSYWVNLREEIKRMLTIKLQIIQSF